MPPHYLPDSLFPSNNGTALIDGEDLYSSSTNGDSRLGVGRGQPILRAVSLSRKPAGPPHVVGRRRSRSDAKSSTATLLQSMPEGSIDNSTDGRSHRKQMTAPYQLTLQIPATPTVSSSRYLTPGSWHNSPRSPGNAWSSFSSPSSTSSRSRGLTHARLPELTYSPSHDGGPSPSHNEPTAFGDGLSPVITINDVTADGSTALLEPLTELNLKGFPSPSREEHTDGLQTWANRVVSTTPNINIPYSPYSPHPRFQEDNDSDGLHPFSNTILAAEHNNGDGLPFFPSSPFPGYSPFSSWPQYLDLSPSPHSSSTSIPLVLPVSDHSIAVPITQLTEENHTPHVQTESSHGFANQSSPSISTLYSPHVEAKAAPPRAHQHVFFARFPFNDEFISQSDNLSFLQFPSVNPGDPPPNDRRPHSPHSRV
ncbi:hypothetical protein MIND_00275100 [Mycena indigotica]|uniref:Uncharacterized protein n=1 Tax=Mycena indigotica TaxID=2126181 RepID=A0A8H6TB36_9AGAR|nr:uncharacterized protein MIND_00275100 [Mycena indigotica]KAF7312610.1 hypothetical protein MIND_00275100 [Mycena indigotica]